MDSSDIPAARGARADPDVDDLDDDIALRESFGANVAAIPRRVVVPDAAAGRLDKVLADLVAAVSRSRIRQWIDAGAVEVNGRTARARAGVAGGDVITLEPPAAPEDSAFTPEPMKLDVVFEDAAVIVLNKPAGLVVHPASGNWSGTLVNGLLAYDKALAAVPRAGIVHRLDADTSGLMVVARTWQAHADLVRQLQERTVGREYWAVVYGETAPSGTIETPIGRDPRNPLRFRARGGQGSRPARTHFRRLAVAECGGGRFSWLACKLDTGRTHQIRVHLESIRHPLVGDPLYRLHRPAARAGAGDAASIFGRQALHAAILSIDHPTKGRRMSWTSLPPTDMRGLMRKIGLSVPRCVVSAFDDQR